MMRRPVGRLRYLILLWIAGGVALGLLTAVCFRLGLSLAATGYLFLIVIVLLSLMDSLISSLVFSVIAVGCLDYFFTAPLFSFEIANLHDILGIVVFFLTSLVITTLVRRLDRATRMQLHQARQLELTHDAIVSSDTSGAIVYWNRAAEELYGWKREEVLGQQPQLLLQTEFPAPFEEIKEILTRTGRWEGELGHTRRDGSKVRVASRWSVQRDEAGRPTGRITTNNDVTERRQAEEMLRRSQAAYIAEAQRLSHTGSFGWNPASGEIFWSDETFRIFGYDPATKPSIELVLQRVHPDDLPGVRQAIERATNTRQEIDFEHRLAMPDGTVKTVHVRAHALGEKKNGAAEAPQFVGAVMDVTARTEAYAALQRTEQRYRLLFEHMPVALIQLRTRGRVGRGRIMDRLRAEGIGDFLSWLDQHPEFVRDALEGLTIETVNEQALRMFGARDAGELIAFTNAGIWQERPDTFRRMLDSRYRGHWTYHEETKVRTIDGRAVDVLFTIARPDRYDSDAGLVLYGFIDITASARMREKLQDLQAEFAHAARLSVLGELAASIAHEVNQPLAAIAASGEAGLRWLDRAAPDITEASAAMRRIVGDARRAGDIIARIRGMAARRAPQQALLPLGEVIEEALLSLHHELQSKQIELSLDLRPLPPVLADRIQLQQVIVNLAINAAQAMAQSNGRRRILAVGTARLDADRLVCTLQDSGPGIAPEHLDRLFESFFTTKDTGIGLGLSISRSIIEGHGGSLRVDNGSAYGGARFIFTLPAARGPG
jgi:PAS domain S-box-containing protein